MEKAGKVITLSQELLDIFVRITNWQGTALTIDMIEGFYEDYLSTLETGNTDDKILLRYLFIKDLKSLFVQAQKDFDLIP